MITRILHLIKRPAGSLFLCSVCEQLLEYYANNKNLVDTEENLLTCLANLFTQVIIITRLDHLVEKVTRTR
ncbi:hypothetical protein F0562_005526 [Nyssa sinensis]|uniref:Uncharacterized protein n=1 Tax=Nyssa sinensis TaxID=561372 RepID=A0A5J5AJM6_9ASTE|nr:hypothetical protein F0562_005526 [Nyssa sinensis]